ncbi:TPA: helix-turn-helix domain-containing protein [Salmonella enterica subsp. enterica serovar Enteritidis]|uniref:helix-turn-helix domain-containing protein n=1 Tax=Salmonella enterica TaxID=28901 RepID=UPI001070895E|nr:helix-turn-helix domain-containing protein [Salmonella enterica]ECC3255672.1 helix-turn-helix domain-containing protein [Salmonella enterica subsp. enterica]ECG5956132.1 helix-turn-helix domain-containing protein [Salmonella enterica subsp. enterica serovar Baguida]EDT6761294.1 helix-turn-helix domain-containing protein [Salmonella enterica subsp. enterica]EDU8875892.1 helix-turn-helix domain-containing protein [Salmonella enterica subsp. enterica]EJE9586981.1 helix-turn-helix domain-contai
MDMKNYTIGERIKLRRKDLKHTQRTLAKALKISHVSVSQWERDDSEPTGKNLFALSKVLQCSPTWILYGDEDKAPDEPVYTPPALDERQQELVELFNALPESEQDAQLAQLRARVENFNKLFEEMLKARQRSKK